VLHDRGSSVLRVDNIALADGDALKGVPYETWHRAPRIGTPSRACPAKLGLADWDALKGVPYKTRGPGTP